MSRELEEYKYSNLELLREIWFNVPEGSQKIHQKHFDLILSKLNELQVIKESNPSKALECLGKVKNYEVENHIKEGWNIILYEEMQEELDTIEQALLKLDFLEDAMDLPTNCFSTFKNRNNDEVNIMRREKYEEYEEQEKVFKIIFEKNVDVQYLRYEAVNVRMYNDYVSQLNKVSTINHNSLNEQEFDLLKRYANERM